MEKAKGQVYPDCRASQPMVPTAAHAPSKDTRNKRARTFVVERLAAMIALDDVIDVTDCAGNKQADNEGDYIVATVPGMRIYRIQDRDKWETPADALDNGARAGWEPCIHHEPKQEDVHQ